MRVLWKSEDQACGGGPLVDRSTRGVSSPMDLVWGWIPWTPMPECVHPFVNPRPTYFVWKHGDGAQKVTVGNEGASPLRSLAFVPLEVYLFKVQGA